MPIDLDSDHEDDTPRHLHERQLPPTKAELRYVTWTGFKNRYTGVKYLPAVEVLQGAARFYWQRDTGPRRAAVNPREDTSSTEMSSSLVPTKTSSPKAHKELPERMRINSWSLLLILSQIVSKHWQLTSKVLLRPFKLLIHYEDQIRDALADLEQIWKDREVSETTAKDTTDSPYVAGCRCNACAEFDCEPLRESFAALEDLRLLYGFIEDVLVPYRNKVRNLNTSWVYFSDMWFLFQPGDHVVKASTDKRRGATAQMTQMTDRSVESDVLRVLKTWGGHTNLRHDRGNGDDLLLQSRNANTVDFSIAMYFIDCDGKSYYPCHLEWYIEAFEGVKELTSLDIYPLSSRVDAQSYEESLRKRGRLFRDLASGPQHRYHIGYSIAQTQVGESITVNSKTRPAEYIDSEVMIDFETALERNINWTPQVNPLEPQNPRSQYSELFFPLVYWDGHECEHIIREHDDLIFDDHCVDTTMTENFEDFDPFLVHVFKETPISLGERDYMLLTCRVFGFVLRTRRWAQMKIQNVRNVSSEKNPMDSLQLAHAHREILQAVVHSHLDSKMMRNTISENEQEEENDFIRGKGLGLIILLHGAPGVGKTSTAECIAMANHKPLFPITCGDLGLTPETVEAELEQKFHLAQLWDCVLLLDEADVFLARRTHQDLERNALVSVFLRTLEYYTGILFLTTNRAGSLDEAFKSRVHLALFYPPLTLEQTKGIWADHIKRLNSRKKRPITANMDELVKFGRNHYRKLKNEKHKRWNGRQIRNAFQTAVAIAEYHHTLDMRKKGYSGNPELTVEHLQKVVQASSDFDDYMRKTHSGYTDEQIAAKANLRSAQFEADYLPEPSNLAPRFGPAHPPQRGHSMQPGTNASNMQFSHNAGFGPGTGLQGGGGGGNSYIANPAQYNNPNMQQWSPSPPASTPSRSIDPAQHVQPRRPEFTPQKARHEDDDDDDDDNDGDSG